MNARSAEGLRAWQLLVERYDPAHQVEDSKLEAYERNLALYEQASGEKISDGSRVGIVLNRVTGQRARDALVVEFRKIPDVGPLSTRACGGLACEGGSVGSLPDVSWSQRPEHSTDGDRRATAAR